LAVISGSKPNRSDCKLIPFRTLVRKTLKPVSMSVRFRSLSMLLSRVSRELATECQKKRTRWGPLRNRDP